jgi:hypothetical protein
VHVARVRRSPGQAVHDEGVGGHDYDRS